jgi:hypothetical protein
MIRRRSGEQTFREKDAAARIKSDETSGTANPFFFLFFSLFFFSCWDQRNVRIRTYTCTHVGVNNPNIFLTRFPTFFSDM